jgi:hypothetical protein
MRGLIHSLNEETLMKNLLFGGVWAMCIAGGAIAGASAADLTVARKFVSPAENTQAVPADLPAAAITIELEPRAVLQQEKGESLELDLHVQSNLKKSASLQYSYELVTDDGRRAQTAELSPIRRLDAKTPLQAKIATPAGLEDGFYRARVTAAASDAEVDVAATAVRYFRVRGGSVIPLSPSEWLAKSNANRAQMQERN